MIPLLDTHQHLIYRDELTYAWSDGAPVLAGKDFTVADYRELTEKCGVAASIFMEVDASDYRKEARLVAELARYPANRILSLIASCRPEEDEGFEAWLDECADMPVVGFRRILHEVSDKVSQTETFRRNVSKIGERGWTYDAIFRADQLGVAYDFALACEGMSLVLDHCGVPDIARGEIEDWREGITALAALPHVNAKISGVLAYCAPGEVGLEAVRPYVDHVIESFGTNRVVWGSDWPVVNLRSALPDWIGIFRELISPLSEDEQTAICNGNAQRIYGVTL